MKSVQTLPENRRGNNSIVIARKRENNKNKILLFLYVFIIFLKKINPRAPTVILLVFANFRDN